VVHKNKLGYHLLDTTNSRAIVNIGAFFNGKMKGMKAVEFKIWLTFGLWVRRSAPALCRPTGEARNTRVTILS